MIIFDEMLKGESDETLTHMARRLSEVRPSALAVECFEAIRAEQWRRIEANPTATIRLCPESCYHATDKPEGG